MNASSTLRRASTHTSTATTNSRITPSIHTRRSTDSRVLDDVLNDGDEIGPGLSILGQPINIVGTRTSHVPSMRVIRKLGTGSYAVVYLVQEIVSYSDDSFLDIHEDSPPATPAPTVGRKFAVKCLSKHALDQDAQLLEATIHQSLPVHDNVVTLWHTLETASYLLLVLDYVPGEDLFYFLEQSRDYEPDETTAGTPTDPPTLLASLPPEQLLSTQRLRLIASMFSQMCDAVAHCHRNRVFHRDIKPENFMVTDSRTFNPTTGKHERKVSVKLTDFGLATRDVESGDMDCGSAPYMSFECNNNVSPTYATAPADVWSLGVVLINMLYHANPWLTTAAGQCESFSHFLREPIPFFMHRFPGMTPAVAEFFARSVFCLVDTNGANSTNYGTNTGRRITAERFGQWARDVHHHLGPSARRTPALAFQQSPNPPSLSSSASRPRSPDEVSNSRLMVPSVSQPATRTPSPSYRTRPPVPVHANAANYGTIDLDSDSDSDNGEPMRTSSSSKRRKRALRGKASPPSIQTDAALYAASILAAKSQEVAREASLMKTATKAAFVPPPTVDLTVTPPPSSRVNTLTSKRSQPELRHKKSNKWTDIFKRDSGSDQELASTVDWATQDREDARTSLSSPADLATAASSSAPSARVQNISGLLQALESVPAPVAPSNDVTPWDAPNGRSSSLSSRGRRNEKRRDNNGQRAASPGSLISVSTASTATSNLTGAGRGRSAPSNDRRARSKSPTQAALERFNLVSHTPPVPAVPESYRGSVPHPTPAQSSRRSYAPSIASVSTATTSSSGFTAFSEKKAWRSSNASVRSVSTAATSVSSGSWRATSIHGQPVPALPSNIKKMDGIPKILGELPTHHRHRPGQNADKKRQRAPSAPTSPAPGSSFSLDAIPEKPKKSAMKQSRPSTGKSTTKNEVGGEPVSSFDPNGASLSFGAARGGKPLGLPQIDTDVANGGSLGYASGEQAQMLIQVPGAETFGVVNASGPIVGATLPTKPPKTPTTKKSWWRKA